MPKKPATKTSSKQYNVKDSQITESSKVIISRIHKQNQNNQNSISKSSQKRQNQTNPNSKHPRAGPGVELARRPPLAKSVRI